VVDATGKLLDTATIYPHVPRNDWDGALHTLAQLAHKHGAQLNQYRQWHCFARDRQAGCRH